MRNIILAAVAVLTLAIGVAPSFAGDSSSIAHQSANMQAGGGPAGVFFRR